MTYPFVFKSRVVFIVVKMSFLSYIRFLVRKGEFQSDLCHLETRICACFFCRSLGLLGWFWDTAGFFLGLTMWHVVS